VLHLAKSAADAMAAHALAELPDEACGLLLGAFGPDESARCNRFEPCANEAASSRVYSIGGRDVLRVDRLAEAEGLDVVGVMHSHTHTEPYPSGTDVAQAPDPSWHYIIVSLRDDTPMLRSFRMIDGAVTEEPVVIVAG
jgi:proteasome lid subunit RPN8/RPN11